MSDLTKTKVERRLKGLLLKELARRVELAGKRIPVNCAHNHKHSFTESGKASSIGLCMYQAKGLRWPGDVCEDVSTAKSCPTFLSVHTKEGVLETFLHDLEHKKLSGEFLTLFWVLDQKESVKLPWWTNLWYRYVVRMEYESISVEPSVVSATARRLLTEAS